ncbi:sticky [Carabus blaptoides fortunei]
MERSKETILARIDTINQKLMECNAVISPISRDTLLDSFVSYFDECSAEYLKHNTEVSTFLETFRYPISELKKLRINISDFEVVGLIGNGHFGSVHLVKERQTGNMYAMKTIRKAHTVNNNLACFMTEREILASTTSSWHTSLQYAFQDSTKLYLVMDYHPGGDLRGLLERQGTYLDEEQAVFYLREILVAISNLHDLGYIHRDIKPDNILLDCEGHIKLTDFGSAARISSEGTVAHKDNIAAGTPDYIAPEVLVACGKPNKVYGRSCDYWSLGIIAYEMIFGGTPFAGATVAETYNNIRAFETKLVFPADVVCNREYCTLVKQLLTDEVIRPGYEKIICTPLFRDTCWDSVRDFHAPFVPVLNNPQDTSFFTGVEIQPQPPNIDNFLTKAQFSGRNLPFIGYTYIATKQSEGPSASTGAVRKDESLLERKQRKIESLRNRLVEFETLKEEYVELEQKYEENKLVLKSAQALRIGIESDLATAMTEASSLRRTLEAERNQRKDLEIRAIDLIRAAKARWKADEDVRNAELLQLVETHTQKITELTTCNNDLVQKLYKVSETAASCAAELQRLRDVQEQYEDKIKNSRDQSRKSFCGLQNQLKLVSEDAESRVESLKKELEDAWNSNQKLQEQSEDIKLKNKLLESTLKANEEDFKAKLADRDAQIAELNHAQEVILEDLTASNERENSLQDNLALLKEEKLKLSAKYDKMAEEKQLRERECEQLRTLYTTNTDKLNGNLEDAVAEQKAKDEIRVKNLENTISQLENEIMTLLPQIKEYETKQTKITELQSLVARLEAGKNKDAAATAREELLKEQLEKSQNKVQEFHETSALSNRELNKIKSELWAKEKALKDSNIDARILSRELQDAQKEIKTLNEQVKICEERAKMAEDLVSVDHERARAAESKHLALVNENAGLKSRVARLESKVQKFEMIEAEAASLKTLRQELEQKIENQQKELADYNKAAAVAKQLEITAKHEIIRLKVDLDAQHTAYAALQESSTILEQQVDGYDRLVVTLKNKESSLETKVNELENDLAAVQEILQSTKQALTIARNDRIGLDTTIRVLEVQMSDLEGEKQSLNDDLARFERRYKELVEINNDTEKQKNEAILKIQNQMCDIDTVKTELYTLKEESSERLTHLLQAREINTVMSEELLRQRNEIDRLTETINETEYDRNEYHQRSQEEIVSLAARLKQFEKVSDSLLDRLLTKREEQHNKQQQLLNPQ